MKKALLILFSIILTTHQVSGIQITVTDSLKQVLKTSGEDTLKVNILISICKNESRSSPDSAIFYGTEALKLSESLGFGKGSANANKYIGMGYYFLGNYSETINYWQQALNSFEAINDKIGVSNILSNLGALYANQGDDVKALDYHLRSLKAAEESKNTLRIATSMINIGVIYLNNPKTHDLSLKYNLSALPLSEKIENNDAIGTASVNIGEVYFYRESYDTALFYYEKSLSAFRKSNSGNVPYTLTNIGKVYMKSGDFKKAIEVQKEGYEIAKQSDAKLEMAQTLLGLAETYSIAKDIKSAIKTYKEASETAEEIGAKKELKQAYEGLSVSYSKMSDYSNAFKYQTLLTNIKDTLYITANNNKIQFLELNYELDKKETLISLQDVKIKKQKFTQRTFIIGFILAILVAIQTYRNYRRKVRTNELLAKQKAEIEVINKNLTDSINYAERIQSAMFPSKDILSENLFEYFILFKPLDIVSGDFYWFKQNNNSIFVAAADCTGHGVPGAFMSILGLTFLNELVHSAITINANEVLIKLKDHVIRTLHQTQTYTSARDGMEMALFILDLETNIIQFSGARRPLYLLRDKQITEFAGDKMPLGIHDEADNSFTNKEIEIKKDDIVYLFSDGFVDQLGGPDRKTFKTKKFKDLLINNCHLSMNEQKEVLENAFEEWKSNIEQIDDILVIGIKFKFGAGGSEV
ncbi:MAG: tetratricopeptide repeat protein [Bacteroidales bacterium]|nr:tetratricopeptide repeat protein [Bacteroidales bacterium]MBK7628435.1 tetratricopeptide repeat protein [Bacteroidales bacterium]